MKRLLQAIVIITLKQHPLATAEMCFWSCMACPHRHMVACWTDIGVLSLACCVSHRQPCCACRAKLGQHQDHKSVLEPPDNGSFGAVTGSPSLDFLCDDNSIFILFDLILNLMFFSAKHLTYRMTILENYLQNYFKT